VGGRRMLTAWLTRISGRRVLAGALLGSAAFAEPLMVGIANCTVTPAEVTVTAGTTVTVKNGDDSPHLVAASDGSFRSKALDTGDSYSFDFTKPGEYGYFCALHPHMVGKVVVKP